MTAVGPDPTRPRYLVMYTSYIVKRTQIYLTEEEHAALERRRRRTGETISQQIRAAIDERYLPRRDLTLAEKLRILDASAGLWKDRAESGVEYVRRLRSADRLRRSDPR